MLLTVWESIREFFKNMINNVMWQNIFFLLGGIIVGILIGFLCYFIFFKLDQRKDKKEKNKAFLNKEEANGKSVEVNKLINKQLEIHLEKTKDYGLGLKLKYIFTNSMVELMRNVAGVYYPKTYSEGIEDESKKYEVLFEVSMDDLIKLINTINLKLDNILNGKLVTKKIKNIKISQAIDYFERKKIKSDEKALKNKSKPTDGFGSKVKNFFFNTIGNKLYTVANKSIASRVFKMIGEETAKVYSRDTYIENATEDVEIIEEGEVK